MDEHYQASVRTRTPVPPPEWVPPRTVDVHGVFLVTILKNLSCLQWLVSFIMAALSGRGLLAFVMDGTLAGYELRCYMSCFQKLLVVFLQFV